MNYRRVMVLMAFLLSAAAVFSAALAQGAHAKEPAAKAASKDSAAVNKTAAAGKNSAAHDKAAAADSTSAVDTVAPVQRGLDIDALLAEDHGDDLLTEEKPVAKDHAPSASASTNAEDQHTGDKITTSADGAEPVSAETAAHAAYGGRRGPPPVADAAPVEAGPVVIEDGRTINFAQNLKEYRSPRLAMLLSLLVPGLGQAYSRNYVKAGGFVAAEVAVIGVAAYLNSVGKSKKRDAHKFADDHFDIDKLKAYETRLLHEFEERGIEDLTYYPYYHHEGGDFYGAAEGKQAYFYESIRNYIYAPGWKDNDPAIEVILSGADTITAGDGSSYIPFNPEMPAQFYLITRVVDKNGNSVFDGPLLGNSNNQVKYNSMVNDANSYHDAVNYMLYVLLVNHIGSAIDAGFTARAYNAKLLGNDGSVWNRLSVEQQYVFTGSEVSAGLALKVRF